MNTYLLLEIHVDVHTNLESLLGDLCLEPVHDASAGLPGRCAILDAVVVRRQGYRCAIGGDLWRDGGLVQDVGVEAVVVERNRLDHDAVSLLQSVEDEVLCSGVLESA
jgi:hypothetical protein